MLGSDNKASAKGNTNVTSVVGNHSSARSKGDNKVSSALGNDKHAKNGTNNDVVPPIVMPGVAFPRTPGITPTPRRRT